MALDPVCETGVEEDGTKHSSGYGGETFYFCSLTCKQKFDRDPEAYLEDSDSPNY